MNRLIAKIADNRKILIFSGIGLLILSVIVISTILLGESMSSGTKKALKETASATKANPLITKNDKDGDGISNNVDKFPYDHDNDGVLDAEDSDHDNDGIKNASDSLPYDHDNDGLQDAVDPDSDNDGIPDVFDNYPGDHDNDGIPDAQDQYPDDQNNDGIPDGQDSNPDGGGGDDQGGSGTPDNPPGGDSSGKPRIIP